MRLTTYLNGSRVGWFDQARSDPVTFEFDPEWQQRSGRLELSLSMPRSKRVHRGSAPGRYLWNLLPDNQAVLERWGRKFGVSSGNALALLANVGLDAAGSVQLVANADPDTTQLRGEGSAEPIDEAGIAAYLRELRADPAAWLGPRDHSGAFSLAGAQAKFTLVRTADGWAIPKGRMASTHIVKPGITGLQLSDLNEHLTMRTAALLGLVVARSRVLRFEGESAIVVSRFDRRLTADGAIVRLHQEDLAQATGTPPSLKYQSDGGPGIADIGNLMSQSNFGDHQIDQVRNFYKAALFNWAALCTDAHAKNYALVYPDSGQSRPVLAPLYDLGTVLAYPELNGRRTKFAMSFGGHYRASEVQPRHLVGEGERLGLSKDWVLESAGHMVEGLADAFSQAAREAQLRGGGGVFAATLVDRAHERAGLLRGQLNAKH